MRRLSRLVLLLLLTVACGCTPSLSRLEAKALVAAREELLRHPIGDIAPAAWPEAVVRLKPERVYRDERGIYLYTYEFVVEQKGIFLLDPASDFIPSADADPRYELVITDVFIYRSAG
ncbi:hypothetical protein LJR143_003848 [Pseudoxanthomonas sp. LjRoot143]|uniref:hypothetical protein n=1 Tax=Pseudoxanthomonas sp. LjRoot143 TaxID=3342266 RepID=UPI003ECD4BC6